MKLFKFLFYGLIGSLLLFGVVMEGFGQVNRDCLECGNSRANVLSASGFILVSQSPGGEFDPVDVTDCDNVDPTNIWLEFEYIARTNVQNVYFKSDLILINNSTEEEREPIPLDFMIGDLAQNTGGGGPNRPAPVTTFRIQITLPPNFDCSNESLALEAIEIHWTAGQSAGPEPECSDYNQGLCNPTPERQIIDTDGFSYNFDKSLSCIREDGTVDLTFEITELAGGVPRHNIIWEAEITYDDGTIGTNIQEGGRFYNWEFNPEDLRFPTSVVVSLSVTDSEGLAMVDPPGSWIVPIPPPIDPLIYNEDLDKKDNDLSAPERPNGFIDVDLEDGDFSFFWTSEDGSFFNDQDLLIDGLSEGIYFLNVTELDENGQPTGACRVYRFEISDITPQPVIYSDINIEYFVISRENKFSWSTTKELEASHFEIERAVSGTQFEKIGEVKAAGWSDQLTEYLFEDKMLPLTGGNLLYRLKQVDFNGDFEYSKVLSVRVPGMQFTSGVWRAFPNPTDGSSLRISLLDAGHYNQEPLTFRLIHPTAQTEAISVPSEKEMNEMLTDLSTRMPKGVFVVEIQWGQKVEHIKVLKK